MKTYTVSYSIQTKPGDPVIYAAASHRSGPFTERKNAEAFAIALAGRMPVLRVEIVVEREPKNRTARV